MLGEPPAGFGAEGGCGGSSQGSRVRQRAESKVQFPEESEILATTLRWGRAHELRRGDAGFAEPLPEGTGLAAAGPGITIEAEELDTLGIFHGLAWQLSQGVVKKIKDGQAAKVTKSPTVDLPDAVVMDKEAVQVDQASEHILREGTDTVSMQEEMCEVDQI